MQSYHCKTFYISDSKFSYIFHSIHSIFFSGSKLFYGLLLYRVLCAPLSPLQQIGKITSKALFCIFHAIVKSYAYIRLNYLERNKGIHDKFARVIHLDRYLSGHTFALSDCTQKKSNFFLIVHNIHVHQALRNPKSINTFVENFESLYKKFWTPLQIF